MALVVSRSGNRDWFSYVGSVAVAWLLALPNLVNALLIYIADAVWLSRPKPSQRIAALVGLLALTIYAIVGFLRTPSPLTTHDAGPFGFTNLEILFSAPLLLFATSLAFVLAICANRGWSANELQRMRIVEGLSTKLPSELPDLRGAAILSAIAIVSLFPLLLFYANQVSCQISASNCLFTIPAASKLAWISLDVDVVLRALNFSIVQDVFYATLPPPIVPVGVSGHALLLVLRATIAVVAVASIFDLLRVQTSVVAAVLQLHYSADPAVAQGTRILPRLLCILRDRRTSFNLNNAGQAADDRAYVTHAIEAIGRIGSLTALPELRSTIERRPRANQDKERIDEFIRRRAARAIVGVVEQIGQPSCSPRLLGGLSDNWTKWRLRRWTRRQLAKERRFRARNARQIETGIVWRELETLREALERK